MSLVAESNRKLEGIRAVYQTHQNNKKELVAFSAGHRRLLNPQVLHTCANLFMSELIEIVVPAVVGICSVIIWYQPSGIRQYVSYLQAIDEKTFLTGLKYISIECAVQLVSAFLTLEGLRRMTDVNCFTVGVFLVRKHLTYYILVVPTAVIFFLTCFVEHWGNDATLKFEWLRHDDAVSSTNSTQRGHEN